MRSGGTSDGKRDCHGVTPENWQRLEAMKDEEMNATALSNPGTQPISPERIEAAKAPAFAKKIRRKLRKKRESFSAAGGIPLHKLIAWKRHQIEPTGVELAYPRLIEHQPLIAKLVEPAA